MEIVAGIQGLRERREAMRASVGLASRDLATAGFKVDYVAVRDAERMVTPDRHTQSLRILAAARLGRARLIDNVGASVAGS